MLFRNRFIKLYTEEKMKHYFVLVCVAFIASALFADANHSPSEKDSSKLLLRNSNWFSYSNYQLLDGTSLKHKELSSLLKTVPENKPLFNQRKGVVIGNWAFAAVAFTSFITAHVYYHNGDLPYAEIMHETALIVGMGALFGELIMYDWGKDLFQRAVDNYNLSIQGIPIPIKK
jgi:hypothetical protein